MLPSTLPEPVIRTHILIEIYHMIGLGVVGEHCGAVIVLERILNILDDLRDVGVVLESVVDIGLRKGLNIVPMKPLEITPVLGSQGSGVISALRTIVIL